METCRHNVTMTSKSKCYILIMQIKSNLHKNITKAVNFESLVSGDIYFEEKLNNALKTDHSCISVIIYKMRTKGFNNLAYVPI